MSQTHREQGLGLAHNSKQDQVQYKILDAQKCFLNLIGFPSIVIWVVVWQSEIGNRKTKSCPHR